MQAIERKLGRIFQITIEEGEDLFEELNRFVEAKNIRAGSVFVFGAMHTVDMISGFRSLKGFDVDRRRFEDRRELVGVGNISWPDSPPAALGDVSWDGPRPFVHIHMALSGGAGKNEEVLVGHLSGAGVQKAFVEIYEYV
ncbi:MAG: PPC domain-containing DNA-binding protein [Thermodesulfobacteriota bacterium]